MNRKGWLIPILVFIFSFSILFFYQKSQEAVSLANPTELAPTIWSKSSSDISKIVYSIGPKKIEASRENDNWFLSNFNNKQADSLYIYTVMNEVLQPTFEEVITVSPEDLTSYGIDENSPTLSLYDNEANEYTLVQGSPIDDTLSYVYVPLSNTVYSMKNNAITNLSINEVDWLNKQLLTFNVSDVEKISFSYKTLTGTLLPSVVNDEIVFSSDNINAQLVSEFVNFLQCSKIQQFITVQATDHVLDVYGFNAPSLECSIALKSGDVLSLKIGNIKKDENICYAMVNNNHTIVAIPYFDFSQFDTLFAELEENNALHLG